eukprot:jgi/Botrbrau1/16781/Bobra.150_2s0015.1
MNRGLVPTPFATRPQVQRRRMGVIEAAQEYVQSLVQQPASTNKYDHKVLHGLWWKDRDLTDFDTYSQQLDLISLGGIEKKAAMFFIRGIRLEAKDNEFHVRYVAPKIPFGLTEKFHLEKSVVNKRRDRREGPQQGVAQALPDGLLAISTWGEPEAGRFEEFYYVEDDKLIVKTKTEAKGKLVEGIQVYRRG